MEIENLEKEIQSNIQFHGQQIARFKKFDKAWKLTIVILSLCNGIFGQFIDNFNTVPLYLSYKLWILILPCVVAINAIFDSKIEIEENQRLMNEKRNLIIQLKTERLKPEAERSSPDAFYEQMADALEIINRGARN